MSVFLPSGQLSGSPCRTQVLVIRDFATMCTCTCQHYYAIFMHSACVHVHMHTYALCGYTRHLRTCWHAAIHVNRPSGISQAAAIAINRTKGVKPGHWFHALLKVCSNHDDIVPLSILLTHDCDNLQVSSIVVKRIDDEETINRYIYKHTTSILSLTFSLM